MTTRLPQYLGSLQRYLDRLGRNRWEHGDHSGHMPGQTGCHESDPDSRLLLSEFPGQIEYKLRHATGISPSTPGGSYENRRSSRSYKSSVRPHTTPKPSRAKNGLWGTEDAN
jgi:hypothetical protein